MVTLKSKDTVAYICGYGSLMHDDSREHSIGPDIERVTIGTIRDMRRTWLGSPRPNMNATKFWIYDLPEEDLDSGLQIAPVFKPAYLDIVVNMGSKTVCPFFAVSEEQLEELDKREAQYSRVEVTDLVDGRYSKPVYLYTGINQSKVRVLDKETRIPYPYYELCIAASAQWGDAVYENFKDHMTSNTVPFIKNVRLGDGNAIYDKK